MNLQMPFIKKFSVRLAFTLLFILLALSILWIIVHEVLIEKENNIDNAVISVFSTHTNPQLIRTMELISFLASEYFLIAGYAALIGWFLFHQKKKVVALSVAVIGTIGFLLVFVMKIVFRRNRPLNPLIEKLQDYSFPSGHTTSGFVFYGLLIYLVWQSKLATAYKWILSVLLLLLSLLIGASRIYLGMHYPSDVLAGFCLGFAWLMIALLFLHRLHMPGNRPGEPISK